MPQAKFLLCERELDGEPGSNSSHHIHPEWSCPFPGETGAAPREPERLGASASADKRICSRVPKVEFLPQEVGGERKVGTIPEIMMPSCWSRY